MKELIYMWIESVSNRANIYKQGIQFSNNYIVELRKKEYYNIESVDKYKNDNIYRNLYGESIINISAIVGINGVGKTTIMDILGSPRDTKKRYLLEWRYFLIYRCDEKYVIEGNGLDIVEDFILNIPEYSSDEFSFICKYDEKTKKFICINFCNESGEIEKSIKYFYFQDKPADKQGYLKSEHEYDTDYNVCFERVDMKPNAANVYKTCFFIRDNLEFNSHINMQRLTFEIDAKTDIRINAATDLDKEAIREVFIIKMLLAIIYRMDTGKTAVERLPIDTKNNIFSYNSNDYKQYMRILEKCIDDYNGWGWDKEKIVTSSLVDLLERIPINFFDKKDRQILITSSMIFTIRDDYSEDIYNLLLSYSDYISFSYCGISAGEKKILDVFSGVFSHVNIFDKNNRNDEKTNIILLDEPDKGLHPEMSRRFISWLVKVFNNEKGIGCKYQFIISTHSPFMISDIPSPYVHCLKHEMKGKIWISQISDSPFGLLNSIPDLMKDTFFMDSPFGEFANLYFGKLVNEITEINTVSDSEIMEKIKQKIRVVNDPVLNKYLNKLLEKKVKELGNVEEQIVYYEDRIKELRGQ